MSNYVPNSGRIDFYVLRGMALDLQKMVRGRVEPRIECAAGMLRGVVREAGLPVKEPQRDTTYDPAEVRLRAALSRSEAKTEQALDTLELDLKIEFNELEYLYAKE